MSPRSIVLDTSVVLTIVLAEPEAPVAAAALARFKRDRLRVVVPAHFWLEVVNAMIRGHGETGAATIEAIHDLDQFALETVDADRALLLASLDLAERHGLTSYDAMYLALADAVDGSLLTFDLRLRAAAGPRGISLDLRLSETAAPYEYDVTWPAYPGASAYLASLRAEAVRGT